MNINTEVKRNPNESGLSLVRRFSRRVSEARILKQAKARQWRERVKSKYKRKQGALVRLARRREIERLKKLGKE